MLYELFYDFSTLFIFIYILMRICLFRKLTIRLNDKKNYIFDGSVKPDKI